MSEKIYVDAVNVEIRIVMNEDVSLATTARLDVRKPSGTVVQWFADVVESSVLRYITQVGDLDEAGVYYVQPYLIIGDWSDYGTPANFKIHSKWR